MYNEKFFPKIINQDILDDLEKVIVGELDISKKLKNVVKKIQDAENRSRNLIICGLTEENGENLNAKVGEMLTYLEEKPMFSTPTRIGNSSGGSVQPVELSLASATMVSLLLIKSQRLRQSNIL